MSAALGERSLTVRSAEDRDDLSTFLTHAIRLDDAAVVRLKQRASAQVVVWTETGFDVLAARVVGGEVKPGDTTVAADSLMSQLRQANSDPFDPGWSMDSAWRGTLAPESGFDHVDDVPARVFVDLAGRGLQASAENGGHGPPASLLDQAVLTVESGSARAAIPMRMVFALTAMGFIPNAAGAPAGEDPASVADSEIVRVRVNRTWLRLDARYGSVVRNTSARLPLSVF